MPPSPSPDDIFGARTQVRCDRCQATYAIDDPRTSCACGGLLDVVHAPSDASAAELRARFTARLRGPAAASSGVWRFRELVMPVPDAGMVSFPEGYTPLVVRDPVGRWAGVRHLRLKHEGMNPTGSFKDRGMTVAVTHARRCGAMTVACASTGNTASSMAAYAALAGMRALVLVPDGSVAEGKLSQSLAYGARTLLVRGNFDDCLRLAREAADRLGVYLANSVNPWRLEGQKTIVFELLDQLDWDPPDWIVLPAGNLGNASAFGKALREALAIGLIDRVPRLALVQAEGAAPFAASAATNFSERVRIADPRTMASAIRIGDPASHERAVRVMRETRGVVTTATDEEILEAKAVIDASGTGCEPASAASIAGLRRLVREGTIGAGARVAAILTGHVLKDPAAALAAAQSSGAAAGRGIRIEPTLAAVERAMSPR